MAIFNEMYYSSLLAYKKNKNSDWMLTLLMIWFGGLVWFGYFWYLKKKHFFRYNVYIIMPNNIPCFHCKVYIWVNIWNKVYFRYTLIKLSTKPKFHFRFKYFHDVSLILKGFVSDISSMTMIAIFKLSEVKKSREF